MKVAKYLAKYNRNEDRLIRWVVQNGGNKATASIIIDSYANIDKHFKDGHALDNSVLEECYLDEKKSISDIVEKYKKLNWKPSKWDTLKGKVKQWIQ